MIITSQVSNFFSNLINNSNSLKSEFKQTKTTIIINILNVLLKEHLIRGYINYDNNTVIVLLKYFNNKKILKKIIQISKPGKKVYIKNKFIYTDLDKKIGIFLISTTQGILTHETAKKLNLGGELLCQIII